MNITAGNCFDRIGEMVCLFQYWYFWRFLSYFPGPSLLVSSHSLLLSVKDCLEFALSYFVGKEDKLSGFAWSYYFFSLRFLRFYISR